MSDGISKIDLLRLAASVEAQSEHPLRDRRDIFCVSGDLGFVNLGLIAITADVHSHRPCLSAVDPFFAQNPSRAEQCSTPSGRPYGCKICRLYFKPLDVQPQSPIIPSAPMPLQAIELWQR